MYKEIGALNNNSDVPPRQLVEARLLDACHQPINTPPIRLNSNISVAGQVAYKLPNCLKKYHYKLQYQRGGPGGL